MLDSAATKSSERNARNASQVTVREAVFGLLRSFGMTTIFGNPGLDRAAAVPRFPGRLPLRARPAGIRRRRHGRRLRAGHAATPPSSTCIRRPASATRWATSSPRTGTARRSSSPPASRRARFCPFEPFLFAAQATELPKPYVKWSCEPARAEDVPAAIARAYYIAMQPPRGPTLRLDSRRRLGPPVRPRRRRATSSRTHRGDPALLAAIGEALDRARPAGVRRRRRRRPRRRLGRGRRARRAASGAACGSARCRRAAASPKTIRCSPASCRRSRADRRRASPGTTSCWCSARPPSRTTSKASARTFRAGASSCQIVDDPDMAAWAPVGIVDRDASASTACSAAARRPPPRRRRRAAGPRARDRAPTPSLTDVDRYLLQQIAGRLRPADSIIVEEAPSSRPRCTTICRSRSRTPSTPAPAAASATACRPPSASRSRGPTKRVIALIGDGSSMYSIQALVVGGAARPAR